MPFFIAEVGGNHEGDLGYAFRLLEQAAAAGAGAVKFQAYRPDGLVNPRIDPGRHAHFGKFALRPEDYVALARRCQELGVLFMASVWDDEYLDLLDPHIPIHKVGSGDLTNRPLIRRLVDTGKPLCIATAMSTLDEVLDLARFVRACRPGFVEAGNLCLMHCTALYGNPRDEFANLKALLTMRRELAPDVLVGYSDHTLGTVAVKIAVELGAVVLEKHFTDDKTRAFRDHHISLTKAELEEFNEHCRRRGALLGDGRKAPIAEVETAARISEFRRAVYPRTDLEAGHRISGEDLVTLRPEVGLSAKFQEDISGRTLRVAKKALEPFAWSDFV